MPKGKPTPAAVAANPPDAPASYGLRERDTHCRIHAAPLDETGFCPVGQAYWWPRFACPQCHGWLRPDGFCASCTPKSGTFPGDAFEERWGPDDRALPGGVAREYGHYVWVRQGPFPALSRDGVLAQLAALRLGLGGPRVREPGEEPLEAVPF